ncbi:hypothetical protein T484DRAFT_1866340 [Baffinella frigidus]|nr:hypothetical protein T484DRAFT_1866340 [Cryptophyta sp. CCMP2293]
MFKQCSGNESPRPAAAASCQADGLAERLGALMLLGKGKEAVTGKVKRFALEKGRPSLLRRAKRRPPALSWDQVEQTLDEGGQRHSGLIEDADVEGSPPVDEQEMPSAPREAFGATREHVEMPAAPHSMITSGSSAPRSMPADEYEKPAAPRRMSTSSVAKARVPRTKGAAGNEPHVVLR